MSVATKAVNWLMWSPRRLVAVGGVALATVGVAAAFAAGAGPGSRGGQDGAASGQPGCGEVAVSWVNAFTDRSLDDVAWRSRLEPWTYPDQREVLLYPLARDVARAGGVVIGMKPVTQQTGACDATVTVSNGTLVHVELRQDPDGPWLVTDHDEPGTVGQQ